MKRMTSVLTAVLALAGIMTQAAPARAELVESGREEIWSIVVDPFNEEPVMLEGVRQYTLTRVVLPDGTRRQEVRANTQGKATGLWSGNEYRFNESWTYTWVDPIGLAYEINSRDVVRLISMGASPNVAVTQTMSIIRDETGKYTFDFNWEYDVTGREE